MPGHWHVVRVPQAATLTSTLTVLSMVLPAYVYTTSSMTWRQVAAGASATCQCPAQYGACYSPMDPISGDVSYRHDILQATFAVSHSNARCLNRSQLCRQPRRAVLLSAVAAPIRMGIPSASAQQRCWASSAATAVPQ